MASDRLHLKNAFRLGEVADQEPVVKNTKGMLLQSIANIKKISEKDDRKQRIQETERLCGQLLILEHMYVNQHTEKVMQLLTEEK